MEEDIFHHCHLSALLYLGTVLWDRIDKREQAMDKFLYSQYIKNQNKTKQVTETKVLLPCYFLDPLRTSNNLMGGNGS